MIPQDSSVTNNCTMIPQDSSVTNKNCDSHQESSSLPDTKTLLKPRHRNLMEKPKRPLSAYNLFFQHKRSEILKSRPDKGLSRPRRSHGKIGFADLARNIANDWNSIDDDTKAHFDKLAAKDKQRYTQEVDAWKKEMKQDKEDNKKDDALRFLGRFGGVFTLESLLGSGLSKTSNGIMNPSMQISLSAESSSTSLTEAFNMYGLPLPNPTATRSSRSHEGTPKEVQSLSGQEELFASNPKLIAQLASQLDEESTEFIVETFLNF